MPWDLTKREMDVLYGLFLGLTNQQIGFVLGIQEQTVKNHVSSLYDKILPNRCGGACGKKYRLLAIWEAIRKGVLKREIDLYGWPGLAG